MPRGRKPAGKPAGRPAGRSSKGSDKYTQADLLREAKKGIGHSEAANNLGVTVGQISSMAWSKALVEAGRFTKQPATAASVRKMRDGEDNRWELIAARIGETVTRAKELYGPGADSKRSSGGATGGRSKPKPSSRTKGKTAVATPRRARTRAERAQARSGNPS
jgi:hypothetical protein